MAPKGPFCWHTHLGSLHLLNGVAQPPIIGAQRSGNRHQSGVIGQHCFGPCPLAGADGHLFHPGGPHRVGRDGGYGFQHQSCAVVCQRRPGPRWGSGARHWTGRGSNTSICHIQQQSACRLRPAHPQRVPDLPDPMHPHRRARGVQVRQLPCTASLHHPCIRPPQPVADAQPAALAGVREEPPWLLHLFSPGGIPCGGCTG